MQHFSTMSSEQEAWSEARRKSPSRSHVHARTRQAERDTPSAPQRRASHARSGGAVLAGSEGSAPPSVSAVGGRHGATVGAERCGWPPDGGV